jgi:light-regulated signal transduction histidine kinase (bacteriophytochrome)
MENDLNNHRANTANGQVQFLTGDNYDSETASGEEIIALNAIIKKLTFQNENKNKFISDLTRINKELTLKNEQTEKRGESLLVGITKFKKVKENKQATDTAAPDDLRSTIVEQAEQLEMSVKELDSFFYNITQELRALLTIMSNNYMLLKEDYSYLMDDAGNENINITIYNSNEIVRLIDNLLQFLQLRRYDVSHCVVDINKTWQQFMVQCNNNRN